MMKEHMILALALREAIEGAAYIAKKNNMVELLL